MEPDDLYNLKIGEIYDKSLCNGILQPPIKCVGRSVTLQDKDENQLVMDLKHPDYIENIEEEE